MNLISKTMIFLQLLLTFFSLVSCTDTDGNGGESWFLTPVDDSKAVYVVADAERIAGTFYVAPFGSNLNEGTIDKPWRSLAYACNHVKEGSTIRLLAGTIYEDSICRVPKNVSIIGKGKTISIVKSRFKYMGVVGAWDVARNKFSLQIAENSENFEISNFTLDGNAHQAHGGVIMNKVKNLTVKDMVVKDFNFNGMWISNSENMVFSNVSMTETSLPATTSCSGMLMLGNTTNAEIANCSFINDSPAYGGYGIKTWNYQWTSYKNWEVDQSYVQLNNVNIHDCTIKLYPFGGWNGNSVNICIEMYHTTPVNCIVKNCMFVGNLSMVGNSSDKAESSVKVLNNQFIMPTVGSQFAIENDHNNVEIAYNYIKGGMYPISSFDGRTVSNLNVHHNIFDKSAQPDGVLLFSGGPKNLKFENNSVLYNQSVFNFNGAKKGKSLVSIKMPDKIDNIKINNNILFCYDNVTGPLINNVPLLQVPEGKAITATNIAIDNNAFYNWTPEGTNTLVLPAGQAVFVLSGKTYLEQFKLSSNSPCVGKNLGAIN